MSKPILCIDFDGVVHSYSSGWQGANNVADSPVEGAIAFLLGALHVFDVCIYSSRSSQAGGVIAMQQWLKTHGGQCWYESPAGPGLEDIRFPEQKPAAFLTIDDRAICFDGDWSKLQPAELLKFKPWNKRGGAREPSTVTLAEVKAWLEARPDYGLSAGRVGGLEAWQAVGEIETAVRAICTGDK